MSRMKRSASATAEAPEDGDNLILTDRFIEELHADVRYALFARYLFLHRATGFGKIPLEESVEGEMADLECLIESLDDRHFEQTPHGRTIPIGRPPKQQSLN